MDCLDSLEIAYVELTGMAFFREEKHPGGIMAFQVYAVRSGQEIIIIRSGRIRHKRIGMEWLKEVTQTFYQPASPISRIERIKFLIHEINIRKVYWKHEITEKMMNKILEAVRRSQEIYDNSDNT